ncbi:MAG: type II secretion system protein GspE [Gammaproteobacteria bacterium]|nr:type II secretion system protein GspE [Gammaproteobacteria bacterium]
MEFIQESPISEAFHPVAVRGKEVALPDALQLFQVKFIDDQSINGVTRGSFLDRAGLHLFKPVGDYAVVRLFVPRQVMKEHVIGSLCGEAFAGQAAVPQRDVDKALKVQEALRRRPLGEYLLEDSVVNLEQLKLVLASQARMRSDGMVSDGRYLKIGEILVDEGHITQRQLDIALNKQATERGKKLGLILEQMGVIDDETLHRVIAAKLGIPFVNLMSFDVDAEVLACIPHELVRKYRVLPLCVYRGHLVIAMEDPTDSGVIDNIRFVTNRNIEVVTATSDDIDAAIVECYEDEDIEEEIQAAEEMSASDASPETKQMRALHESENLGRDKPIVRFVNRIIADAIHRRVSDIHIRPLEDDVELLYRIDGTLIKVRDFSKDLLPAMVSRIKILGRMNIAERRLPQDGRTHVVDRTAVVDLRISVIPTSNGESVVIRLLNTEASLKALSELGFSQRDENAFSHLLHKSNGMILATGPTGSGKSTTLYAALQEVITQNVNIITVEDPIEYHINGIEQIQVNTAPGYTFARALRHILRHDPDVIMIGEIRDQETAKIAVESALTGHLVLSTLHTNDAAGAITRLLEMGVESFFLKATLLGILAQRLVRRNCPYCSQEEIIDPKIRKILGVADNEVFFKGAGCDHCEQTGYSGRMAVYELLSVTPSVRALILADASVEDIRALAVKEGMLPLTDNALMHARQRTTSLSEVYRVRLD